MPKGKPKGKAKAKPKTTRRNRYVRASRGLTSYKHMGEYKFVRTTVNPLTGGYGNNGVIVWGTAAQSLVFTPYVGQLPNWSDFSALFDMYRLDKIVLYFEPMFTGRDMTGINYKTAGAPVASTGVLQSSIKYMRVVYDYNDSTALANENEALEYQNCKSFRMGSAPTFTLYPKLQGMVYRTTVTTGYETQKPKFLSTSDSSIPHYGMKFFVNILSGDANDLNNNLAIYNVRAEYHITMKNVK